MIGSLRYFCSRFFAPFYWPKVGEDIGVGSPDLITLRGSVSLSRSINGSLCVAQRINGSVAISLSLRGSS